MERILMQDLTAWKNSRSRKPLIVYGARQTGKTWLLNEFGRQNYAKVAYVDLTDSERARHLFDQDFDINRIVSGLAIETGIDINPHDTLVIIDEAQEAPRAITSLKYFYQKIPSLHVVAAGSYLGLASHEGTSFPVGKVDALTLHPLDFNEFLLALGQEKLANIISKNGAAGVDPLFSTKLTELLKEYLYVGGMPEVVADYVGNKDIAEVRRLQKAILSGYDQDFSKHAPLRILERMRLVWGALPTQLAKEKKKFIYGTLRSGARARDFEECIQWLVDYGVVQRVSRVSAIRLPLSGYEDTAAFKLFCVDVGLLGALASLQAETILAGSSIFTEFKGSLTEQYVLQQLAAQNIQAFYWSSDTGKGEVDFVVGINDQVVPIEVKSAENLKAKSLKVACEKFDLSYAIRTSLSGYRVEKSLTNIPLWAIGSITAEHV